jgi:hypothetical protein
MDAQGFCVCVCEIRSHSVALVYLELTILLLPSARITGVYHHTTPISVLHLTPKIHSFLFSFVLFCPTLMSVPLSFCLVL